ncbi:type A von willebrand factor domain protein (macronuclear) [Tetrahymena thermophila SB210]|uniref:Type A von willebrand factor domain protein n=1 Tax=Tetrahymena thermophila (strain SB210) TaxID=312017 RepID=Q22NG1_TETTS|nr:type A von willebrand factor domain protein [Tetrahymena thermophila SB210]EAR86824.1 type A von willebrand factor domain protein [Tetrahymena thermophila SB210]|eukprot:XP_001007069.1 type A von willebrand factor domain protein [Tetrahymena thermophila SB210]
MDQFFVLQGTSEQGNSEVLEMLGCSYECDIINQILRMKITQEFDNKEEKTFKDVKYQIPIKQDTCLESFTIIYNQDTITGMVVEKEEGKQMFEQMTSEGQTALYAEKSDNGELIEINVGNVAPNDKIKITVQFSSIIKLVFSQYFYLQIPLMEKQMMESFEYLKLKLTCTGSLQKVECISHNVQANIKDGNEANLLMTTKHLKGSKQFFELIYSFEGMYEPSVILGEAIKESDETTAQEQEEKNKSEESEKQEIPTSDEKKMNEKQEDEMEIEIDDMNQNLRQSCFISFTPDFGQENKAIIDQHIQEQIEKGKQVLTDEFVEQIEKTVLNAEKHSKAQFFFLIDRSGSMCTIFQKARDTLIEFLQRLPDDSYFNVISFGSGYQFLFEEAKKKNKQSMKSALEQISKFSADMGGTEIYQPLEKIFQCKNVNDLYQMQIFLLTDGQVSQPDMVVQLIRNNSHKARVHCIGLGSGVDKQLLRRCSESGRGANRQVDNASELKEVVINVLENSFTPSYTKFQVEYDKSIVESIYPQQDEFPSVLKNEQFFMHIFLKKGINLNELQTKQKKVKISYYNCTNMKFEKTEIELNGQDQFLQDQNLKKTIFLIGKQLYLNRQCSNLKQSQEQKKKIIEESVKYQLVTPLTSYISSLQGLTDTRVVEYEEYKVDYTKSTYRSTGSAGGRHRKNRKKQGSARKSAPATGGVMKPISKNRQKKKKLNNLKSILLSKYTDNKLWKYDQQIILQFIDSMSKLQELIGYFFSAGLSKDLLCSIIFSLYLENQKGYRQKEAHKVLSQVKPLIEQSIKKSFLSQENAFKAVKKYIKL